MSTRLPKGTILGHGKLDKIDGDYAVIKLDNGDFESVMLSEWEKAHGEVQIGTEVEKVVYDWSDVFAMNYWGFVPKGFKVE